MDFLLQRFLGIKGMGGRGVGLGNGEGRHIQGLQVFIHVYEI